MHLYIYTSLKFEFYAAYFCSGIYAAISSQVLSGDVIPVDGVVVHGAAAVSAAHVTGESAAPRVGPGAHVSAGSNVREGRL